MSEFGAHLKQAREGRGISLRQIALSTKISTAALEALERGDLSKLPGGIFSRAFVRAYAEEVGLNPDEVIEWFLKEQAAQAGREDKPAVVTGVSPDDRAFLEQQRRAAAALRIALIVLVVVVVFAVVWWQWSRQKSEPPASTPVLETVASAAAATPAPVVPPPAAPVDPPAPAPAASTAPVWIELTATANCWIQVTADGAALPGRVFGVGERERFEAKREIVLQVGSAGAVSWTVMGKPARSLGRPGEVRTVTVTPANASSFYAEEAMAGRPTPTASATTRP